MAKLTQEDISRLEQHGITIGATVTCAVKARSKIIIKSWDDWELEGYGCISSVRRIDVGSYCWLYLVKTNTYATVVKPAPSVKRKFKKGDIVLRGKHGTIPHKVTGYASDNIVTLTSCETGKLCQSHQDNIRLKRNPPKPTPSYEVDWSNAPKWAAVHCFNESGVGYWIKNKDITAKSNGHWMPCESWNYSKFALPNGLDWKSSKTYRPEAIKTEQPKPEPTIDEQIEAARAELERLEKIKQREVAVTLPNHININDTMPIFIGLHLAPTGLENRCIMFKTEYLELRTQQHNEYTVLTFHRK